ncbi:DNA repair exonuclease [Devosia sp. WQ 349]|uniref:metallophosphoesterase family protein n=1 Tax=Devosia sp. WQ 349K1 TaxID=2800329 RepID=UPI001908B7DA|nr:DNA repair exonuclease [Devosia sp. WQ 349K1]MBK1792948.1 DNA repair exonuclease [Devosia sp. WQ 349K1]
MTSFRFLHAADLHLGAPFKGLALKDVEVAARFAQATRQAFSGLVQRAIAEAVDFVVIAGDIYDGDWKDNAIGLFFNREMARLAQANIPVYLLKGNHDAESVVTKSITLPDSVFSFDTRRPASFRIEALALALHGQGFADRSATENLALAYPPPVAGWFNIGVLHTSLTGRPPHANYAPCSLDDLRSRGYDYWALGHVHEHEVVSTEPMVVFPGNLQGRSIRETGPRGAVLVTVEDSRVASVERILVDEARWAVLEIDIAAAQSLADILRLLTNALATTVDSAEGKLLAIRVRLTGSTPLRAWMLAQRAMLVDEIQAACHRLHPDIWLEKLDLAVTAPRVTAPAPSLAGLDMEGLLAALAVDPAMLEQARAIIGEIAAKLPAGLGAGEQPLGDDPALLLAEARDLLIQSIGDSA